MSPAIRSFLERSGVDFRVHDHPPIVSFADARAVLPFDPDAMVKGLAFRLEDGRYVIAGLRARDRADYKKIADALGARRADLRAVAPDDLSRDLSMEPGGVVPLPINGTVVLFDSKVRDLDTVYCGTGCTDATLEISSVNLIRIAGGRLADLTKPDS